MIVPVASVISPDGPDVPNGLRRITLIERLTANNATLTLTLLDEDLDDRALVRIDNGGINVLGTEIFASGEFKGFQTFTTSGPWRHWTRRLLDDPGPVKTGNWQPLHRSRRLSEARGVAAADLPHLPESHIRPAVTQDNPERLSFGSVISASPEG
jgi:hypothetical protein